METQTANAASKSKKKNFKGGKKRRKEKMSVTADKYDLYQRAVQDPKQEVSLFRRVFSDAYGRLPQVLREDFCGTFAVCCEWAAQHPEGKAIGVDLDPEPLNWGRSNNLTKIDEEAQSRVHLYEDDVRMVSDHKADVIAGMNFSYFIFKTRSELKAYFKSAYDNLNDEGTLVLDIFGGHEVLEDEREETESIDDTVEYIWEQHSFDPISHDYTFYIHFEFEDGSKMRKAFRYHWRLWSIPEVRELLEEAGFKSSSVYWEGTDEDTGEGTGEFMPQLRGDADPAWISYIVARK